MSVYFATCREANAVKIGSSIDPYARLPEIQHGCPLLITIEAVMPGDASEEFRLHRWFTEERIRGEWFTITEEIERLIEKHAVPPTTERKRRNSKPRPVRWRWKSQQERYAITMAEMQAEQEAA